MTLSIQITAETPEGLRKALIKLAAEFGAPPAALTSRVSPEQTTTEVHVAPAQTPPDVAMAGHGEGKSTEAPAQAVNVVKELTPAEMRVKGSDALLQLFNKDPSVGPKLGALQAKYSVKKFADIPDDKAQDFYTDAMLLVNGTSEVKAG